MKRLSMKDWLWLAVTLAGVIYGYGALNTRVAALEEQDPIAIGRDVAVLKSDTAEIKSDMKDVKKALGRLETRLSQSQSD